MGLPTWAKVQTRMRKKICDTNPANDSKLTSGKKGKQHRRLDRKFGLSVDHLGQLLSQQDQLVSREEVQDAVTVPEL